MYWFAPGPPIRKHQSVYYLDPKPSEPFEKRFTKRGEMKEGSKKNVRSGSGKAAPGEGEWAGKGGGRAEAAVQGIYQSNKFVQMEYYCGRGPHIAPRVWKKKPLCFYSNLTAHWSPIIVMILLGGNLELRRCIPRPPNRPLMKGYKTIRAGRRSPRLGGKKLLRQC